MKILMGVLMFALGLIGLMCTTCGALFILQTPLLGILLGIAPGLAMLWGAVSIARRHFSARPDDTPPP